MDKLMRFLKDEDGATAVEYALLVGLLALVIAAGAEALGGSLSTYLEDIGEYIAGIQIPTV